ncbi:MAG: hypothetical protein ACFB0A_05265 [Croceivirga sp.]
MINRVLVKWLIGIIWGMFFFWELQVQQMLTSSEHTIRYDLVLLPSLVVITGFVIYLLFKKEEA